MKSGRKVLTLCRLLLADVSSYEIGPAIGKGGYAVVYKGIRQHDGLVVAIKR